MDYNKENKGFVCWVYNFQRTKKLWLGTLVLCAVLFIGSFFCKAFDPLSVIIRSILLIISLGAAVALIKPKSFWAKLIGYIFIFLGVIFGLSYSKESEVISSQNLSFPFGLPLNEWLPAVFMPSSDEIASGFATISFVGFAIVGAFFLVMILSWFVYNARSSEINQI